MLNRVLFLLLLSLNLFANENIAKRLILAYPLFLEKSEDNFIYFKDGSKLQFSTNNKDLSYEEIAATLQKSVNTIYGYRDRVFKKLQVKQRTAMVMTALKRNYIDL